MKVINVEIFEKVHSKPYITRMHASRILWILYLRQQNNLKHKYLDLGLKKSLPLDLDGPILYSNWCKDLKIYLPLDGFVFKPWHICRVTTLERKRWGLGLFL